VKYIKYILVHLEVGYSDGWLQQTVLKTENLLKVAVKNIEYSFECDF
jgi:hypothetical protein